MKDIYISMNTQNILGYYGTKLDLKLDSSEFFDYEIGKNETDFNTDVLTNTPIVYSSLKISDSLEDFSCEKTTIIFTEFDNRVNDPSYPYSGFTTTISFLPFADWISSTHQYDILNNNVYVFNDINGKEHYMMITGYNQPIYIDSTMGETEEDIINNFSQDGFYKCTGKLESPLECCGITPKFGVKPWVYQFLQPEPNNCVSPIIDRREEKGWTLDFIFNRESLPWSEGGQFYYFGGVGSGTDTLDNSLEFSFTSDGRIQWQTDKHRFICVDGEYVSSGYSETGVTPTLCTTGMTKDFNVTIVFDRYNRYTGCDLENEGGWNDLKGIKVNEYQDLEVTAVTSTQITTYDETESFTKKWEDETKKRMGVLKIYLNGRPIYKKENFEEVVALEKSRLPFLQSWGGSPREGSNNKVCCFNIKSIKYYEEPLDFVHIRHNFITRLNQYDFFICGENCEDDLIAFIRDGLLTEDGIIILTESNDIVSF